MVQQVKPGSSSSSTVEMDTVPEHLEKIVLLIGQCNNMITYERRKNMSLGVTGTFSSRVASMFEEKAAFLQKHDFWKRFQGSLNSKFESRNAIY